jgi:hypothetical protein
MFGQPDIEELLKEKVLEWVRAITHQILEVWEQDYR